MSLLRRRHHLGQAAGHRLAFAMFAGLTMGFASIVPGFALAAENPSTLEETMQPIAKVGAAAPVCRTCSKKQVQDGNGQRMAERAAPEYPAPRRAQMTAPTDDGAMSTDMQPGVTDAMDSGSLLSLPGATVTLPALLP